MTQNAIERLVLSAFGTAVLIGLGSCYVVLRNDQDAAQAFRVAVYAPVVDALKRVDPTKHVNQTPGTIRGRFIVVLDALAAEWRGRTELVRLGEFWTLDDCMFAPKSSAPLFAHCSWPQYAFPPLTFSADGRRRGLQPTQVKVNSIVFVNAENCGQRSYRGRLVPRLCYRVVFIDLDALQVYGSRNFMPEWPPSVSVLVGNVTAEEQRTSVDPMAEVYSWLNQLQQAR